MLVHLLVYLTVKGIVQLMGLHIRFKDLSNVGHCLYGRLKIIMKIESHSASMAAPKPDVSYMEGLAVGIMNTMAVEI